MKPEDRQGLALKIVQAIQKPAYAGRATINEIFREFKEQVPRKDIWEAIGFLVILHRVRPALGIPRAQWSAGAVFWQLVSSPDEKVTWAIPARRAAGAGPKTTKPVRKVGGVVAHAILEELKDGVPLSVFGLQEQLEYGRQAIQRNLVKLIKSGHVVQAKAQRTGKRGRPMMLYTLAMEKGGKVMAHDGIVNVIFDESTEKGKRQVIRRSSTSSG